MGDVSDLYGMYCDLGYDLVVWHSGKYFWISSGSIASFKDGKVGPRAAGNTTIQYKKESFTLKLPGEFLWC